MVKEEWPAGSIRCKAFITTIATAMCHVQGKKHDEHILVHRSGVSEFQTGDVLEIETRTNFF